MIRRQILRERLVWTAPNLVSCSAELEYISRPTAVVMTFILAGVYTVGG